MLPFEANVNPVGRFGHIVSSYTNSMAPYLSEATSVICDSGAFTCSGSGI
jgi:UDP-N-acetylglucosamine:LPS N-acetylglucosamine transferase